MTLPNCPKCDASYTYENGHTLVCPMCYHEWTLESDNTDDTNTVKDSNGTIIQDGDKAVIIMDLKLGNCRIKQGTKVTNIKTLDEMVDDHNLQGKVEGYGTLYLKGEVIKRL